MSVIEINRNDRWQFTDDGRDRERVLQWLRDHGIDPNDCRHARVEGKTLHAEMYLSDAEGKRYIDTDSGEVATEVRTVRVQHAPPECLSKQQSIAQDLRDTAQRIAGIDLGATPRTPDTPQDYTAP